MSSTILVSGVKAIYHDTLWYVDASGDKSFDKKVTVGPFVTPAVTKVPVSFPNVVPGDDTLEVISADLTITTEDPKNIGHHVYVSGPIIGGSLARKVHELAIPCRLPLYHQAWDTHGSENAVGGILGAIFDIDLWLPVIGNAATGIIDVVLKGITGKKKPSARALLISCKDAIPHSLYQPSSGFSGSVSVDLHFSSKGMVPQRAGGRLGDLRNNDYTLYCLSDAVMGSSILRFAPQGTMAKLSRRPGNGFWYHVSIPCNAIASLELVEMAVMSLQCDRDDPDIFAWTGGADTDITHIAKDSGKSLFGEGAVASVRANLIGDESPSFQLCFDFQAYTVIKGPKPNQKTREPAPPFWDISTILQLIAHVKYRAPGGGVSTEELDA